MKKGGQGMAAGSLKAKPAYPVPLLGTNALKPDNAVKLTAGQLPRLQPPVSPPPQYEETAAENRPSSRSRKARDEMSLKPMPSKSPPPCYVAAREEAAMEASNAPPQQQSARQSTVNGIGAKLVEPGRTVRPPSAPMPPLQKPLKKLPSPPEKPPVKRSARSEPNSPPEGRSLGQTDSDATGRAKLSTANDAPGSSALGVASSRSEGTKAQNSDEELIISPRMHVVHSARALRQAQQEGKRQTDLKSSKSFLGGETIQSLAMKHQIRKLKSVENIIQARREEERVAIGPHRVQPPSPEAAPPVYAAVTPSKKIDESRASSGGTSALIGSAPTPQRSRPKLQLLIDVPPIQEAVREDQETPLAQSRRGSNASTSAPPLEKVFCPSPILQQDRDREINGRALSSELSKGLQINLSDITDQEIAMQQSYNLSASGTFNVADFQIKKSGITKSPEKSAIEPVNIQGNIVKLCVLGKGASGVVHKALHLPTFRLVAVKVIPVFESEKRHQMVKELRALYSNMVPLTEGVRTKSPCPFVVSFYDAFINPNEGNISIVVEYMDGGSLQDIVESGGCAIESVLANISRRILKGLAFIHEKHQVHRDIKPGNLLIDHKGHVKVSDFGIVRDLENSLAKANTFVGTLTYMSPERIAGESYSYSSDIWSFGLSVMTCALGKFPLRTTGGYWSLLQSLREEKPPELPKDKFSPEFCDFITQCLHKDKDKRASAKQLLQHPFLLAHPQAVSDDEDEQWTEHDDVETAMGELTEVLFILQNHCMSVAGAMQKQGGDPMHPVRQLAAGLPAKIDSLSYQIGIRREIVEEALQTLFIKLTADVQALVRHRQAA